MHIMACDYSDDAHTPFGRWLHANDLNTSRCDTWLDEHEWARMPLHRIFMQFRQLENIKQEQLHGTT